MANAEITKKALATSLRQLMETIPFSKVSISDICRHVGMSRKSYYYHFKDKYDIVIWIFQTECYVKCNHLKPKEKFEKICTYLYDNRVFYAKILSANGQNALSEYIAKALMQSISFLAEPNDSKSPSVFEFYKDALIISLRKWLTAYKTITPDSYIHFLKQIFDLSQISG